MLAQRLGLMSLAVSSAAAMSGHLECGSVPTEQHIEKTKVLTQVTSEFTARSTDIGNSTTVQLYYHVVYANETTEGGYMTNEVLEKQLETLNHEFGPQGFVFEYDSEETSYYGNEEWATLGPNTEAWDEVKNQTRKGTYQDLNIWFTPDIGAVIGGFCSFPEAPEDQTDWVKATDGCVVTAFTVPGGAWENYDQGMMAVHEVGHWFNLYHTFHSGCEEPGDFVDDTPLSETASWGCPIGRNSCPDAPGFDPIHNHMDYTHDSCKEGFTPGQRERMVAQWTEWRSKSS